MIVNYEKDTFRLSYTFQLGIIGHRVTTYEHDLGVGHSLGNGIVYVYL